MSPETPLAVTATLAKAYADQGHLNRAAQIYRQLLQAHPGHEPYAAALRAIAQKQGYGKPASDPLLIELLATWIELESEWERLDRLSALRNRHRSTG